MGDGLDTIHYIVSFHLLPFVGHVAALSAVLLLFAWGCSAAKWRTKEPCVLPVAQSA